MTTAITVGLVADTGSVAGPVIVGIIGVVVFFGMSYALMYNRLISDRDTVVSSWATIDAELQRRHQLIPPLVEVVRRSAAHELGVLQRAASAAERAVAAGSSPEAAAAVEPEVRAAAHELVALGERTPELRTSAQFLGLQRELVTTEDRLAAARRYYNTVVARYNRRRQTFPSNIAARRHRMPEAVFFSD